jgi:hypothetical protein
MPTLTRRRNPDARQESWLVYYGDVRVGTIAIRSGNPTDTDPWGWNCGFYPGSHPTECASGTAVTFDQARADFEEAWPVFLANRTHADFDEYRKHRAWTAGNPAPNFPYSRLVTLPFGLIQSNAIARLRDGLRRSHVGRAGCLRS